jgi:hypothetical protein
MKTLLNTLLIATMTCSFAVAQRYDTAQLPTADHSSPKEMDVKPEPQKPGVRAADAQNPAEPKDGAVQQAAVTSESEPKYDAVEQRVAPDADALLGVTLSGSREEHLILKAEASELDKKILCLVIASLDDTMVYLPGLPPLLMTDIVVASGLDVGAVTFDMGPAKLPFTVYTQAVITDGTRIASSNLVKVEAAL